MYCFSLFLIVAPNDKANVDPEVTFLIWSSIHFYWYIVMDQIYWLNYISVKPNSADQNLKETNLWLFHKNYDTVVVTGEECQHLISTLPTPIMFYFCRFLYSVSLCRLCFFFMLSSSCAQVHSAHDFQTRAKIPFLAVIKYFYILFVVISSVTFEVIIHWQDII